MCKRCLAEEGFLSAMQQLGELRRGLWLCQGLTLRLIRSIALDVSWTQRPRSLSNCGLKSKQADGVLWTCMTKKRMNTGVQEIHICFTNWKLPKNSSTTPFHLDTQTLTCIKGPIHDFTAALLVKALCTFTLRLNCSASNLSESFEDWQFMWFAYVL